MKLRLVQMVGASKKPLCASCGLEKPECSNEKWYDIKVGAVGRGIGLKCSIFSYCRVRDQRVLRPCRELAAQSVRARVFSHLQLVNKHLERHYSWYLRGAITRAISNIRVELPQQPKRVKSVLAEWTLELVGQLIRDRDVCAVFPELDVAMPVFWSSLEVSFAVVAHDPNALRWQPTPVASSAFRFKPLRHRVNSTCFNYSSQV